MLDRYRDHICILWIHDRDVFANEPSGSVDRGFCLAVRNDLFWPNIFGDGSSEVETGDDRLLGCYNITGSARPVGDDSRVLFGVYNAAVFRYEFDYQFCI